MNNACIYTPNATEEHETAGGRTKTCAAASIAPHACKLEGTAPGSVRKKGTRRTAAEFQRL